MAKKKRQRKSPEGRSKKSWVVIPALVACTTLSFTGSKHQAFAQRPQTPSTPTTSQSASPGLVMYDFSVPAGSLGEVLTRFHEETKLVVLAPDQRMLSVSSPGVTGLYTAETALKQLLEGTGIAYQFTGPQSAVLRLQSASTVIDVIDAAPTVATPKFTEPVRDTPQTISFVPLELMQQQGTTTLRDALRNVAGISIAAGEGGAQGDNLTIRGFTARNDIFLDGMRDFGSYYRDPFAFQDVAVLQGPAAVAFGRGTTGGVVNQEMKTPEAQKLFHTTLNLGSDLTKRATVDFNRPLGDSAAFRLNLMGHDSDVAGRDIAEYRRFGVAPSVVFGLNKPTRLTLNYFHVQEDDIPDYGIPWFFDQPARVDRRNYYGFRDGNHLRTKADVGTARVEHSLSSSTSLRNQFRYANYNRDVRISEAQIPTAQPGGPLTPGSSLESLVVNRRQIAVNSDESFAQNQFDVTTRFATGGLRHALVVGVEAGRETSSPIRPTYCIPGANPPCSDPVPQTSLVNPNPRDTFTGSITSTSYTDVSSLSLAAYVLDTVKLGNRWELSGGIRWDRFDTSFDQRTLSADPTKAPVLAAFDRVDNLPTWRAALVYKPADTGSVYIAYGTSANPSAEALSLSASTVDTEPEKNRTIEAGTKWDFAPRRLSLRMALFRTDKTDAREPDVADPLRNVLAGKQRVQGIQTEVTMRVNSRWNMVMSYAFLDSAVLESRSFARSIGLPLANVPDHTFNFWDTYELPWRLTVGAGGQYTGNRVASSTAQRDPVTNLIKDLPGYWVFNAMARYPLGERVDLQVNIYNIADRYYFDQVHPGHVVPGPGRSVLTGLNFKF